MSNPVSRRRYAVPRSVREAFRRWDASGRPADAVNYLVIAGKVADLGRCDPRRQDVRELVAMLRVEARVAKYSRTLMAPLKGMRGCQVMTREFLAALAEVDRQAELATAALVRPALQMAA